MLDQFARQNRWWIDPNAIDHDRHLRRLRESRLQWTPPLPFHVGRDAVYVLRGPRQVGKSTVLKRQVAHLLDGGWPAGLILYLDIELAGLERGRDLVDALRAYLDTVRPDRSAHRRCVILLDEVTRLPQWAGALRGLIDNDELDGVTVIATGSHTTDLREGGERLPGRRGGGGDLDIRLLPLSFREYLELAHPEVPLPEPVTSVDRDTVAAGGDRRVAARRLLAPLLHRYLATGGYLVALNDEATHGMVRAETFQLYREAIVGEFTRAGLREAYLREVVNWIAGHLGQEFDSRGIAADTDIGSKDTARNYVDHLVNTYVIDVAYRANALADPTPAFRAPKKMHAIDPLVFHLLRGWAASDPDPWPAALAALARPEELGHLVESVVVVHLRRLFGDRVFYWRPDQRREIDVVVASPGNPVTLVEVKYQSRVTPEDVRELQARGGGIVLTRETAGPIGDGGVHAVPAAELLARLHTAALAPGTI